MKRTKILAIAFSLALSTGYSQQKPYNANDITTWRFENSKGELESFSQLPKYQQEILLANYSDYKKLDRESLSKLKFNNQPVIVWAHQDIQHRIYLKFLATKVADTLEEAVEYISHTYPSTK
jgi:hypothetical protein